MVMKRTISVIFLFLCLVWVASSIRITFEPFSAIEAAFPQVQTGQIADESITFSKLTAALQAEWDQFRGLVGTGETMTWTVSPVTQITDPDTTLTVSYGIEQIEGIGGITLVSLPTIAAGVDGQLARIRCVSDVNLVVLQSESNLPGSGLIFANGKNFSCGRGDSILMSYNGLTTRWEEMSRIDIQ